MFELGPASLAQREGLDPRLIEIDDLAIQLTLIDYGHSKDSGLRTDSRQYELFLAGVTLCDGIKNRSNHQAAEDGYGKALDFVPYVNGAYSYLPEHLAIVACAYFQAASILGYTIKWGGLWKSSKPKFINGIPYGWDMPHIELVD